MTNDKQVEVWRDQFEQWYRAIYMNSPIERDSDSYIHGHAAAMWGAWLAAKRYMQPIDMTLGQVVEINDFDRGYNKAIHDACIRIKAAGYSYRVK